LNAAAKAATRKTPDGELLAVDLTAIQIASLLSALESAGQAYDAASVDGPSNVSAYAASVKLWWNGGITSTFHPARGSQTYVTYVASASASSAWHELDRLARYVYSLASPSDQATAGSAFGVSGSTAPDPLLSDVTGASDSTLAGRVTAALACSSVPSTVLGLVTAASATWTTILAARPAPDGGEDSASDAAIAALQSALANAQAYIEAAKFE
jgi:hypothetical protein